MKYYGKEKCRILKEIRAEIARANDIAWVVSECKHKGNCKGTCPKCEQEVRELEDALAKRAALGKKVAVVGISATLALSVTGCDDLFATGGEPLAGDMIVTEEQQTENQSPLAGKSEEITEEFTATAGEPVPETEDFTAIAGVPMYPEPEMGEFPE